MVVKSTSTIIKRSKDKITIYNLSFVDSMFANYPKLYIFFIRVRVKILTIDEFGNIYLHFLKYVKS